MRGDSKDITSVSINYVNLDAYKTGSASVNVILGRVHATIVAVGKQ